MRATNLITCLFAWCAVLASAGCVDDHKTANLTATWGLKSVAGAALPCPTNFQKVQIVAQPIDSDGFHNGPPFDKLFDCTLGTATVLLPTSGDIRRDNMSPNIGLTGKFIVTIQITEPTGMLAYESSLPTAIDLSGGDMSLTTSLYDDGGYSYVNWTLAAMSNGSAISCATAGVDMVQLRSTNMATSKLTIDQFPCTGVPGAADLGSNAVGGANSSPLVAGDYSVVMVALTAGQSVGMSDVETHTIMAKNMINSSENDYFIEVQTR